MEDNGKELTQPVSFKDRVNAYKSKQLLLRSRGALQQGRSNTLGVSWTQGARIQGHLR